MTALEMNPVEIDKSITFLNMSGDVTITWDDHNEDRIIELIRKKMNEGYSFFTLKKVPLLPIHRRKKVNEDNLETLDSIIIDDDQFERMVQELDDRDVVTLLRDSKGRFVKRRHGGNLDMVKRAKTAEEVVKNKQAVGIRKIAGG